MIGSPDLLAFTGGEGFWEAGGCGGQDPGVLPEELSVPLLPPSHPWAPSSTTPFPRDFILVAEFSEQVGPQPVLTVPDDSRVLGAFDLNHFSLRIMSVDYQACSPGPSPSPPGHAPHLSFSEDSRVVLGDSGTFAYVQHLTLYDLEARGFVRPFCLAYVSADHRKLMEHFLELSQGLGHASHWLKTGNRRAFATELTRKLQDLEYTRSVLQKEGSQRTVNDNSEAVDAELQRTANELAGIERSILEHRDLLRQVASYPNRKQSHFLPYDWADPEPSPLTPDPPSPSLSYAPRRVRLRPSRLFDRRLKPLEELSDAYFLSLTLEQLGAVERSLRGDYASLRARRLTHTLATKHPFNFLFQLRDPEGEGLPAEAGGSGGEGLPVLECEPPPASLDSFFSCVEEVSIKLETGSVGAGPGGAEEEEGTVVAVETVAGSVSSGDSIEVLGTERSYRTQAVVTETAQPRESSVGVSDGCGGRVPAAEAGLRRVRSLARRANSEDSIEVLSTTDSIFPDDLAAIAEETEEAGTLGNAVQEEEQPQDTPTQLHRTLGSVVVREGTPDSDTPPQQGKLVQQAEASCLANGEVRGQCPAPEPLPPSEAAGWLCSGAPLRQSVDEASDCTSYLSSSLCSSDLPSLDTGRHGNARHRLRRRAGSRALRFLRQNSFSQHAVFCLLSGRPLLVIGGDERSVRRLVATLTLYLPAPGRYGDAVQPCLATPLQLTDLLSWRLIGIVRPPGTTSPRMHHSLAYCARYAAVLDLDQRTLRCPSYSGSLIGRLADPRSLIGRGSTYLLHLESCLTALANRALVYTFSHALHRPGCPDEEQALLSARRRDFLLGRGCSSQDDLKVMHFLSDLIKQHHTGSGPPVLGFSCGPSPLHRNTAG